MALVGQAHAFELVALCEACSGILPLAAGGEGGRGGYLDLVCRVWGSLV